MYKVTFCRSDGSEHKFIGVEEIAVGEYIDMLEEVKSEELLKYVFPTKAVYQLKGRTINVTFVANPNECIFVKVEQG